LNERTGAFTLSNGSGIPRALDSDVRGGDHGHRAGMWPAMKGKSVMHHHPRGLSRRTFLTRCAGGILGGGAALVVPRVSSGLVSAQTGALRSGTGGDDTIRISIVHTTDLHGRVLGDAVRGFGENVGGIARCATQIRRVREENPNTILLDIGDTLQGTDVGWRSRGEVMVDSLNALRYDGWALGNHEFDWGLEPVHNALLRCRAPVIGTNLLLEGQSPEAFDHPGHPLSRIASHKVVTVAGIRIGLLGFTTPGMPYWFPPAFHAGMTFLDCAEPARRAAAALRTSGIDALVLFGHMGLRDEGDNQSNQVRSVIDACPDAAAYIGAHSHRLHAADDVNGVLYTQANFWGSHVGRLDLIFDRGTHRLRSRETRLEFMGPDVPMDPVIIDLCRDRLDGSARALRQPVGHLARTLSVETAPGKPSEVERLIGAAMIEALHRDGHSVDGVIHGLFERRRPFEAGEKTVADLWPVMPFENYMMTADLLPRQIAAILDECYASSLRNLMGMRVETRRDGDRIRVARVLDAEGRPVDPARRYVIAFNTWDAQSGGGRFPRLREILLEPGSRRVLHRVQTRHALIEFFGRREKVESRDLLALTVPAATTSVAG